MVGSRRAAPGPRRAPRRIHLPLAGLRVGFLAQHEVEELHLWVPWYRLQEEGATCFVIGNDEPKTYVGAHGLEVKVDEASWQADPDAAAGFVIPGGYASDYVRRTRDSLSLIRYGYHKGKVVAAIERGVWVLISAGIVEGRSMTGPDRLAVDLRNAGARVIDEDVVVDGNLITARDTAALPGFCRVLVAALAKVASEPPTHPRRARAGRGGTR